MTARYDFTLKGRRHLSEPYRFKASGLPNVYLLNGVKIEHAPDYGEIVSIDRLPDLIMAIAFNLVAKPDRLTGAEMRFLRKRLKATQDDLANELWVSEQTVANYEKGKTDAGPCPVPGDRALRFLFLGHVADDGDMAEELRLAAEQLMRPSQRNRRAPRSGRWLAAAQGATRR